MGVRFTSRDARLYSTSQVPTTWNYGVNLKRKKLDGGHEAVMQADAVTTCQGNSALILCCTTIESPRSSFHNYTKAPVSRSSCIRMHDSGEHGAAGYVHPSPSVALTASDAKMEPMSSPKTPV
jgi:hypothetical protein